MAESAGFEPVPEYSDHIAAFPRLNEPPASAHVGRPWPQGGLPRPSRVPLPGETAGRTGARAYTSGNHVVIGDGGADKHTVAHELTHVISSAKARSPVLTRGAGSRSPTRLTSTSGPPRQTPPVSWGLRRAGTAVMRSRPQMCPWRRRLRPPSGSPARFTSSGR